MLPLEKSRKQYPLAHLRVVENMSPLLSLRTIKECSGLTSLLLLICAYTKQAATSGVGSGGGGGGGRVDVAPRKK